MSGLTAGHAFFLFAGSIVRDVLGDVTEGVDPDEANAGTASTVLLIHSWREYVRI